MAEMGEAPLLALGATAARSALGATRGIGVIHGRVVERDGRLGLATYHPAAALRGGDRVLSVMREDLAILRGLVA